MSLLNKQKENQKQNFKKDFKHDFKQDSKKNQNKIDEYLEIEFEVNDDTPIGFGKLRGKPHKELLKGINDNYRKWIIDQGPEFKYALTRQYILDNMKYGYKIELEGAVEVLMKYKTQINKHQDIQDDLNNLFEYLQL